jgi:hypothetical protein
MIQKGKTSLAARLTGSDRPTAATLGIEYSLYSSAPQSVANRPVNFALIAFQNFPLIRNLPFFFAFMLTTVNYYTVYVVSTAANSVVRRTVGDWRHGKISESDQVYVNQQELQVIRLIMMNLIALIKSVKTKQFLFLQEIRALF